MDIISIIKTIVDVCKDIYGVITGNQKYKLKRELISACKERNLEKVEEALEKGADVNAKDVYGRPVLVIASSVDDDKNPVDDINFYLVNKLLEYGRRSPVRIKVDAKDYKGNTALIKAARNGNWRIVEALIKAGADVNAKNDRNFTALMRAEKHGFTKTAQILREHGAIE